MQAIGIYDEHTCTTQISGCVINIKTEFCTIIVIMESCVRALKCVLTIDFNLKITVANS
jgi:hypothetical protein